MVRLSTFTRQALLTAALFFAMPAPAIAAGGYEGLIAPPSAPAPAEGAKAPAPSIPQGYSGVVIGATPQVEKYVAPAPAATQPREGLAAVLNEPSDELPMDFSTTRHGVIDGKMAAEYAVAQNIETALASVNDTELSDEERRANARRAYRDFSDMAEGLRSKMKIPDRIYKKMGLSDAYIKNERIGNAAALSRLSAVLDVLRPHR
jgi:hypothetical protein